MKELTFNELENTKGGMPCWLAKAGLIAAGIGLIATIGAGWFLIGVTVAGLSVAEIGYLEACYPELMS